MKPSVHSSFSRTSIRIGPAPLPSPLLPLRASTVLRTVSRSTSRIWAFTSFRYFPKLIGLLLALSLAPLMTGRAPGSQESPAGYPPPPKARHFYENRRGESRPDWPRLD